MSAQFIITSASLFNYLETHSNFTIIIKSIPYEVNKSTLLQKIDMIRIDKKVDGISEILDQSDQQGLEIHINCKKDANMEAIIMYLLASVSVGVKFKLKPTVL